MDFRKARALFTFLTGLNTKEHGEKVNTRGMEFTSPKLTQCMMACGLRVCTTAKVLLLGQMGRITRETGLTAKKLGLENMWE